MSGSVTTRAARTGFFWQPYALPSLLPTAEGAQQWRDHMRTQVPSQGGKCQKMTEKHQLTCQVYLFALFSRPPAAFDHSIFRARTFPLLTCPWALSAPSQTLRRVHEHGLHHPQISQASGHTWVGKNRSQSSCMKDGRREVQGGSFVPIFRGESKGSGGLWVREDG